MSGSKIFQIAALTSVHQLGFLLGCFFSSIKSKWCLSTRRRYSTSLSLIPLRHAVSPVRRTQKKKNSATDALSSSPTSSFSSSRHNSAPYSYVPPNAAPLYQSRSQSPPPPPQHSTRPLSLFDADQQHPHPTLMQNFISVLFDQMASEFTFFSYSEVMNNFMERRITSILSNSIAAFAAQYVVATWWLL